LFDTGWPFARGGHSPRKGKPVDERDAAGREGHGLAAGERLRVLATDRAAIADFQAFCRETGHALVAWSEDSGTLSFVIRKKEAA